jgi:hypothetical protein
MGVPLMNEPTGFGRTAVNSGFASSEHVRSAARLPTDMVHAEAAASALAAALGKKHTFDCAQPTRGGLCDC